MFYLVPSVVISFDYLLEYSFLNAYCQKLVELFYREFSLVDFMLKDLRTLIKACLLNILVLEGHCNPVTRTQKGITGVIVKVFIFCG